MHHCSHLLFSKRKINILTSFSANNHSYLVELISIKVNNLIELASQRFILSFILFYPLQLFRVYPDN